MTKKEAQICCDVLNSLGVAYAAECVDIGPYLPGNPCGVRISHSPTGNEVGFVAYPDEWQCMLRNVFTLCDMEAKP